MNVFNNILSPMASILFLFASVSAQADTARFLSIILKSTEDVWHAEFKRVGAVYVEPKMVYFSRRVQTGCGTAPGEVGPFYCPFDQKIYIDLSFLKMMETELGTAGDMAQAYSVAHEVGHHVQNRLGILKKAMDSKIGQHEFTQNQIQVRLELHADCLAGVWARIANRTRKWIEPGDIKEVLNAAKKIGDDNLAKIAGVKPEPLHFTHGSGEQRQRWFTRGILSGDPNVCHRVFSSLD